MKLTHTGDNGLACLLVGLHTECGVFFSKFLKADAELVEIFLSLGLNGDSDNGFGEFHCFEHDRSVLVAESVTCADILEAYACADITAADFLHGVLLVGVHLEQTAHTLFLVGAGVEHVATGNHVARVDAEECQTAYIGVGGNLECEGTHGCVA